ncbi:MAG: preprotein translocase subunit SecY [Methanophagales archaeon]|nr:preprotein translocase subunit SecY [Methanophagales archaeon]
MAENNEDEMGLEGTKLRDAWTPFLSKIPMVERPGWHVHFKAKLGWTVAILILFFVLGNVPLFGLSPESLDLFGRFRAIFAGESYSLTALGVMPIINASIILQILAGPKIMKLNLTNPKDQAFYLNMQKLLVLCFAIFISFTYAMGFYMPNPDIAHQLGVSLRFISFLLFLQVFIGGMLVYYMEEVVSRWGIGSGVGLFIVAGVSHQIINGLVNWVSDGSGFAVGVIPRWIEIAGQVEPYVIAEGVIVFLFQHHVIALITTVALFFLVIYLLCACIELKIPDYSKRRQGRIRFPIRFVHFTWAIAIPLVFLNLGRLLQSSIQGLGRLLYSHGITILGTYEFGSATSGLMFYLDPIYSPWDWFPTLVNSAYPNVAGWQIAVRISADLLIMFAGSMLSAWIWVKLSPGMETRDIRTLIRDSGIPIRGYRRSIKAIKRAVDRYTVKIAMMGCGLLGALLVITNMFGTLGAVSVVYLILAVSIIYGLYEEIKVYSFERFLNPLSR